MSPTTKLEDIVVERIKILRERQTHPEDFRPVSTGLKDLNTVLNGGLPRHDNFYVSIIGKEKMGKTTFGLQFFMQYCEATGQKGVLYNLEENSYQAADRAITMRSTKASRTTIFKMELTEEDFEHFDVIADDISRTDIYINDDLYKLKEILTDAKTHRASIIGIDNFQLLADGLGKDQREKLVYLSKELMRARNSGLKIFLLSQGTDDGKSFGSTQVGMDADLCILMEHIYDGEKKKKNILPNLRRLRVTQSRFSPIGELDVVFEPAYSRVRNAELKAKSPDKEEFMTFEQLDMELKSPEEREDFDNDDNDD